jgi:replicative DNA helicase
MSEDFLATTERALLGSLMLDNEHFPEAAKFIRAEDFALDSHQRIYRRACETIAAGKRLDIVTLLEELERHAEISSVGGYAYLASLTEGLPRRPSVAEYVRIVEQAAKRRRTQVAISRIASRVQDPGEELESVIASGISSMLELQASSEEPGSATAIVPLLDRMQQEHIRTSDLLGLPTGVTSLDTVTRGLQASELVVLGARSGVGKSAFMIQAAIANCKAGNHVMIFSLEMTREQIFRRILASISGVPFVRVRDAKWATDEDMARIRYAAEQVADWPLEIDPNGATHVDQLTAKARHAIRRKGVKLVCVDYAQIVPADGRDERLRVAAVSRGLTRLAKDEGVPVLLLSQLSRPDKSNATRRPRLSDLRETSQLENDASVAVLLHRLVDEEEQFTSQAELIIAKQRSGATGIFPVTFNQTTLMFEERKAEANRKAVAS